MKIPAQIAVIDKQGLEEHIDSIINQIVKVDRKGLPHLCPFQTTNSLLVVRHTRGVFS
jgi:hypothetical protein